MVPSKFWNYEGQCIGLIVAGRREVFPGRVASLRKGCRVGIKMCWGPKSGDLIKEMKIIQCGPPSLLPQLNSAEGGRANAGQGSPLRDRSSANPAFLAVLPGAKRTMFRVPKVRSPWPGRLWTSGRNDEGSRQFSLSFSESWPVSIYITQLNPQKQERGGRSFSVSFLSATQKPLFSPYTANQCC